MSLLEQQALLETEPPRRVVIPRSVLAVPSWWGVDASTLRLNVGWVARYDDSPAARAVCDTLSQEAAWWETGGFLRGCQSVRLGGVNENEGQRLALINGQVDDLVGAMLDAGIPEPAVIWVEHPTGTHPKPQLYYAVGVAAAAFYMAVKRRVRYVPRVEFTVPMHWKKVACGRGNISKPKYGGKTGPRFDDVRETYGVLMWARMNGYTGAARDCWDDADALALAEGARREVSVGG